MPLNVARSTFISSMTSCDMIEIGEHNAWVVGQLLKEPLSVLFPNLLAVVHTKNWGS